MSRTPEQIIGHDRLTQLIFEGYVVVPRAERDALKKALNDILTARPAGNIPKFVSGQLIERIEKVALAALTQGAPS